MSSVTLSMSTIHALQGFGSVPAGSAKYNCEVKDAGNRRKQRSGIHSFFLLRDISLYET
jgi:hypothetical protein